MKSIRSIYTSIQYPVDSKSQFIHFSIPRARTSPPPLPSPAGPGPKGLPAQSPRPSCRHSSPAGTGSAVQCSTVLCSVVQCSVVQCSALAGVPAPPASTPSPVGARVTWCGAAFCACVVRPAAGRLRAEHKAPGRFCYTGGSWDQLLN
jgi:hypothetical protein